MASPPPPAKRRRTSAGSPPHAPARRLSSPSSHTARSPLETSASAEKGKAKQNPLAGFNDDEDDEAQELEAGESAKDGLDAAARQQEEDDEDAVHCAICLSPIDNKTAVVPCLHSLFCFGCIRPWTDQSRRCPLCLGPILSLYYNIRSQKDFQTLHLHPLPSSPDAFLIPLPPSSSHHPPRPAALPRHAFYGRQSRNTTREEEASLQERAEERALERRKYVYREGLYAKHIAANRYTRFKAVGPAEFVKNSELKNRVVKFVRRELQVFPTVDIAFLTTYLLSIFQQLDLRSVSAIRLISDFLSESHAEHLVHEIDTFARSPFTSLEAFDRCVQYGRPILRERDEALVPVEGAEIPKLPMEGPKKKNASTLPVTLAKSKLPPRPTSPPRFSATSRRSSNPAPPPPARPLPPRPRHSNSTAPPAAPMSSRRNEKSWQERDSFVPLPSRRDHRDRDRRYSESGKRDSLHGRRSPPPHLQRGRDQSPQRPMRQWGQAPRSQSRSRSFSRSHSRSRSRSRSHSRERRPSQSTPAKRRSRSVSLPPHAPSQPRHLLQRQPVSPPPTPPHTPPAPPARATSEDLLSLYADSESEYSFNPSRDTLGRAKTPEGPGDPSSAAAADAAAASTRVSLSILGAARARAGVGAGEGDRDGKGKEREVDPVLAVEEPSTTVRVRSRGIEDDVVHPRKTNTDITTTMTTTPEDRKYKLQARLIAEYRSAASSISRSSPSSSSSLVNTSNNSSDRQNLSLRNSSSGGEGLRSRLAAKLAEEKRGAFSFSPARHHHHHNASSPFPTGMYDRAAAPGGEEAEWEGGVTYSQSVRELLLERLEEEKRLAGVGGLVVVEHGDEDDPPHHREAPGGEREGGNGREGKEASLKAALAARRPSTAAKTRITSPAKSTTVVSGAGKAEGEKEALERKQAELREKLLKMKLKLGRV